MDTESVEIMVLTNLALGLKHGQLTMVSRSKHLRDWDLKTLMRRPLHIYVFKLVPLTWLPVAQPPKICACLLTSAYT